MSATTIDRSPWKRLIAPAIATVIMFAILCSLGAWQWRRLHWKEALIAQVDMRLKTAPVAAPGPVGWSTLDLVEFDYTPVTVSGTFLNDKEAHLYGQISQPRGKLGGVGWWIYTPLKTDEGWIVYVNRGFVPDGKQAAATRREGQIDGHVTVTGLARRPETPSHLFGDGIPADDQWFAREPSLFAKAAGFPAASVAPYSIDANAAPNPGGMPQGGETLVVFSNNHLQYVVTWFGLAFALLAVFAVYARGVLKGRD
ncbi:surfeit 1 [Kaistia algarum]|uniref:SURF1 family protein n=1 Tax=Kaistia algarum TaxID=2083279 RepID=UPI000CE8F939|nr:SURF1 family protein [Kaistia algarum]MCX5512380.1 SURF1 family protein [Kaistia algarum]PPE80461.1 surfeit 1 [Kaistia algarum]